MALRRTNSSHYLREKVIAYQIIDHDFQLVRRRVVGAKLRKRYGDPHKSNCLEHHLEQIIGSWRLCRNFYAPGMLHESEALRSHRSHTPIFALGRKYGKSWIRHFHSLLSSSRSLQSFATQRDRYGIGRGGNSRRHKTQPIDQPANIFSHVTAPLLAMTRITAIWMPDSNLRPLSKKVWSFARNTKD